MLTRKLGLSMKRELREAARGAGIVEELERWRVARKPRAGEPFALRCQGDEAEARRYFGALDVRQGAAVLLAPGQPLETAATLYTARQSGPNLRTRW